MSRVGFIGLGSQGGPMALRIAAAGHPLTVWARRPATLEPFAGGPATVAGSPAELAAASELVCLCVTGDQDVTEVGHAVLADMAAGSILVVHSTVHPETCRSLAAAAAPAGVGVVDAPVSGGGMAAEAGRLLVMVGGAAADLDRCLPVLSSYGDPIVHMGPLGTGQITKLLNNVLFTAHLAAAADTLALGRDLAVDPVRLAEVVGSGSGASFALARVASGGGTLDRIAAHAGGVLAKDVALIADLAAAAGTPDRPVLRAAGAALEIMRRPG